MPDPDAAPEAVELKDRLLRAQVGGCTCVTKTPELTYHDALCNYRLCAEAVDEITRLEGIYQSAVKGRRDFRQSFRDARATTTADAAEVARLASENARLREALAAMAQAADAQHVMRDTKDPRKLDDYLSWSDNDRLADKMLDKAKALARSALGGAS